MGKNSIRVFVGLIILAGIAQLVLGAARHPTSPTPSPTASAGPSATGSVTSRPTATPKSTPRPSPTPVVPTYVPTPALPTVTVSGPGSGNSRQFGLNDSVGYEAHYRLSGSCQYFATLQSIDGSYSNTDFINGSGPASATTILSNVYAGTYYITMSTSGGCSWSVTFTPR